MDARYRIKTVEDGYGKKYYRIKIHQFGPFWDYYEDSYDHKYETDSYVTVNEKIKELHDNYLKQLRR